MSERYEGQTFYQILEVSPESGPGEIYNAYQKAKVTYSPSSPALYTMFTPEEAQDLMALIEEAYQTLSHQARRREYDTKLGLKAPANAPSPMVKPKEPTSAASQSWVGPVKSNAKKDDLPQGFARTKYSVYEINPELENEIANLQTCTGKVLQKIRLYRGVTLDQMADEMRVSKGTLVALEDDDLEALPVAVFTRGIVVQYTRMVCLDERHVTDCYMKFFKAGKIVR